MQHDRSSGFAEPSIQALCAYWDQVEGAFRLGLPTVAVLNPRGYALASDELAGAAVANLDDWTEAMTTALGEG